MKLLTTILCGMLMLARIQTYSQVVSPCCFDEMQVHDVDEGSRGGGGYDYVEYVNAGIPWVDRICPVVVHVIHNNGVENISDCQIEDAFAEANQQLTYPVDSHIRLELARMDPDGNCTTGIERIQVDDPRVNPLDYEGTCVMSDLELKQLSMWDQDRYINIYIVEAIVSTNQECLASPLASGYVSAIPFNESTDGIVMAHEHFGHSGTASLNHANWIHELGHYFYLYHVWGNNMGSCDNCHLISQCLTHGDLVCDTDPAVAYVDSGDECSFDNFCTCQIPALYDYGDVSYPSQNYMSYNLICQLFFSPGQITRMQWCLYGDRVNLGTSASQELAGLLETPSIVIEPLACHEINFSIENCWSAQTVEWDFGDGSPHAFDSEVTHIYACEGNFEVICKIYRCPDNPEILTDDIAIDCDAVWPSFSSNIVDETCFGGCNGSITISGFADAIVWIGPDNFTSMATALTDLCPGNYYGSFGSPGSCYTQLFVVNASESDLLVLNITAQINASCFECCDAVAEVEATGGTPPYTYTIDGSPSGTEFSNLCEGTYEVEVTDSFGCTGSLDIIITEPDIFEFTSFVAQNNDDCDNNCNGGVEFSWTGGYPPYDIFLNNVLEYDNYPSLPTSFYQLCNGDYTLTIVDNVGNTIEQLFTVTGIDAFFLDDVVLNDGDVNPFIEGGQYYVAGDLIIQSGSFLLDQVTLKFNLASDIIVEEGADLFIEFSLLTACSQRWHGIDVKSSTNTTTPPGSLYIEKSKIYFADIAIQSYDETPVYTSGAWFDEDGNAVYYWIPTLDQFTAGSIFCIDTNSPTIK